MTYKPEEPRDFLDRELAFLEDVQQVVRQIDIALVEFVHEEYARPLNGQQGGAERTEPYVGADVYRLGRFGRLGRLGRDTVLVPGFDLAQVRLLEAADRVVAVQAVPQD